MSGLQRGRKLTVCVTKIKPGRNLGSGSLALNRELREYLALPKTINEANVLRDRSARERFVWSDEQLPGLVKT